MEKWYYFHVSKTFVPKTMMLCGLIAISGWAFAYYFFAIKNMPGFSSETMAAFDMLFYLGFITFMLGDLLLSGSLPWFFIFFSAPILFCMVMNSWPADSGWQYLAVFLVLPFVIPTSAIAYYLADRNSAET